MYIYFTGNTKFEIFQNTSFFHQQIVKVNLEGKIPTKMSDHMISSWEAHHSLALK